MSIFKNEVGRPSNEIKRKRTVIIVISVVVCLSLVALLILRLNKTLTKNSINKKEIYLREKTQEEKKTEEYVSDFKADDAFYDKYFSDYEIMQNMNNLDNVLIVMSKEGISNNFGATFMVTAPDYTYYLQYNNENEKEIAYKEFSKLKDEGKVFEVNKNDRITTYGNSSVSILANGNSGNNDSGQWYKNAMGLNNAYLYMKNISTNIRVAICDRYPFNDKNYKKVYNNYFSGRSILDYKIGNIEYNDHGIHVSSTADDALPKAFGISQYNLTNITEFITTMDKMRKESGVYVINLSWGKESSVYSSSEYSAINRALDSNVITVAATPDSETSNIVYPAAYSNVISVSGITPSYQHMWCTGDYVDFVAPSTRIYCSSIEGPGTCDGTSVAAPLVASAVAMLKYYDKTISLDNTRKLLALYANTNLRGFKRGKDGWGNGLVYLGNTKIFEDVKNKDYESGPNHAGGSVVATTDYSGNQGDTSNENAGGIFEILYKLFDSTFQLLKSVDWSSVINTMSNIISACSNPSTSVDTPQEKTYDAPKDLVISGNYYLISNYKNTQNMKKIKDYPCDTQYECYANAYFMSLNGKVPVKYYGHCNTGNMNKLKTQCNDKNGKILYVCSKLCPKPNVSNRSIKDVYNNIVNNNKSSILTITGVDINRGKTLDLRKGNNTYSFVVVGITKNGYYHVSKNGLSSVNENHLVVIDPYDGQLRVINLNSIDSNNITFKY